MFLRAMVEKKESSEETSFFFFFFGWQLTKGSSVSTRDRHGPRTPIAYHQQIGRATWRDVPGPSFAGLAALAVWRSVHRN